MELEITPMFDTNLLVASYYNQCCYTDFIFFEISTFMVDHDYYINSSLKTVITFMIILLVYTNLSSNLLIILYLA